MSILFTLLLFNHWLILIKKLIISTKLTIPLDSRHQTPNKWNETIPTLFSRVRIRSTVFIFIAVSITSLYNGGFKNGNFVVKITCLDISGNNFYFSIKTCLIIYQLLIMCVLQYLGIYTQQSWLISQQTNIYRLHRP